MKKFILILLSSVLIFNVYSLGQTDITQKQIKSLHVIGVRTTLDGITNPDVFFEGTAFEAIKPSLVLNGKNKYQHNLKISEMDFYEKYKYVDPENKLSLINSYNVTRDSGKYKLEFYCEHEMEGSFSLNENITFSTTEKLNTIVDDLQEKKALSEVSILKIHQEIKPMEFEKLSKEIIQETADYIEAICLIDGNYTYIVFRKTY